MSAPPKPDAKGEPEFHPLANIFPLLEGEAYAALVEDIKKNGLREKIKLHEGRILDGRNRSRACKESWVTPRYEDLPPGTDPLAYVVSANLHRRHLNETQRGIVAAKLANMRRGGRDANPSIGGIANISQEQAAKLLNVSTKTVERASKLVGGGVPELVTKAEQGEVKVSAALNFVEKPEQERQKLLTDKGGDIVKAVKSLKSPKGGNNNKKTARDRFEDAWDELELPDQEAFVETKYNELAKLMKEVDRKAKEKAA
jgi:hypothetical protein